jgi:hypothetical protein
MKGGAATPIEIYARGFCCLVFMNYERPNLPAFLTVVLLVLLSIIVLGEVQDYYNPPITEQHNPALTAEPDSALELDKEQSQQPQRQNWYPQSKYSLLHLQPKN